MADQLQKIPFRIVEEQRAGLHVGEDSGLDLNSRPLQALFFWTIIGRVNFEGQVIQRRPLVVESLEGIACVDMSFGIDESDSAKTIHVTESQTWRVAQILAMQGRLHEPAMPQPELPLAGDRALPTRSSMVRRLPSSLDAACPSGH